MGTWWDNDNYQNPSQHGRNALYSFAKVWLYWKRVLSATLRGHVDGTDNHARPPLLKKERYMLHLPSTTSYHIIVVTTQSRWIKHLKSEAWMTPAVVQKAKGVAAYTFNKCTQYRRLARYRAGQLFCWEWKLVYWMYDLHTSSRSLRSSTTFITTLV